MIIGFYGKQGSGKTLLSVRTVIHRQKIFKNIYSNIEINGINHKHFSQEFFKDVLELKIKDALIFWDEIQEFVNSRKFMSSVNMDIGTFIRQCRKANNTLIWTSQFVYQVDKVLRSNTDVYIKAHSNYEGFNKSEVELKKLKIWYEIFEVSAEGILQLINKKLLKNAYVYAKLYDSSQLIKNEMNSQDDECLQYFNDLCYNLEPHGKKYNPNIHPQLIRFAKNIRTDVFKIYKIKKSKKLIK